MMLFIILKIYNDNFYIALGNIFIKLFVFLEKRDLVFS